MTSRENIRPDSKRRAGHHSLGFERLPELRPGPPAGYRQGFRRGLATGLSAAFIALLLLVVFASWPV